MQQLDLCFLPSSSLPQIPISENTIIQSLIISIHSPIFRKILKIKIKNPQSNTAPNKKVEKKNETEKEKLIEFLLSMS